MVTVKENEKSDFIRTEYKGFYEFYLWLLSNRHTLLTIYLSLFSLLVGSSVLVYSKKAEISGAIGICCAMYWIFVLIGLFFLERFIANMLSTIYCIFRMNEIRMYIAENYSLDSLFRPLVMGAYQINRLSEFGRYRLAAMNFIILLNAIVAGAGMFAAVLSFSLKAAFIVVCPVLLFSFYLQKAYSNHRIDLVGDYLKKDAVMFNREVEVIKASFEAK